jgi:hypothetical protein
MRDIAPIRAAALILLACGALISCGRSDEPSNAEKAAAKREKDAELLALTYPRSTGVQPASMQIAYDGATGRTTMTLRLTGMRISGTGSQGVRQPALHLSSSYKGQTRAPDNPEGSVDGSLIATATTPGALAFSGAPGTVTIGSQAMPLKKPSEGEAYTSARAAGAEESVRFRFPTEHLIAAVNSGPFTMTVGTLQLEISGQNLADLKEFAARLNPRP